MVGVAFSVLVAVLGPRQAVATKGAILDPRVDVETFRPARKVAVKGLGLGPGSLAARPPGLPPGAVVDAVVVEVTDATSPTVVAVPTLPRLYRPATAPPDAARVGGPVAVEEVCQVAAPEDGGLLTGTAPIAQVGAADGRVVAGPRPVETADVPPVVEGRAVPRRPPEGLARPQDACRARRPATLGDRGRVLRPRPETTVVVGKVVRVGRVVAPSVAPVGVVEVAALDPVARPPVPVAPPADPEVVDVADETSAARRPDGPTVAAYVAVLDIPLFPGGRDVVEPCVDPGDTFLHSAYSFVSTAPSWDDLGLGGHDQRTPPDLVGLE